MLSNALKNILRRASSCRELIFANPTTLLYLLELLLTLEPSWKFLHDSLFELTTFAIAIRYPGMDASKAQAERSVGHCRVVRETIRPVVISDVRSC